ITTPFRVKIPKGITSRLGHIGESYQISQWYPKPAVYDNNGWHPMSYLDQGEFYSEFGSFDVSITLPSNYVVGATGNLQNVAEMEFLEKLSADTSWMSTSGYNIPDFPPSSAQTKTLRYTESRIHDFAWFADKRFHVMKGSVQLPESGREIITWVMFTDRQAGLWKKAPEYSNNAISRFSDLIGEYPYKNFTAVQGALSAGAGMEYPGIVVIGLAEDAYALEVVITHEVSHSWFYSALGSNERRFPFMDESLASAYENRYFKEKYPLKKLWEVYLKNPKMARFFKIDDMPLEQMQELEWLVQARSNQEQVANLSAEEYSPVNYNTIIYNKAAQGFNYLRAYLGDDSFDAAMQAYYHKWKFHHPQPTDLQLVFESQTNKDLSWFFNDFLTTTKRLDYKAVRIKDQQLLIKNRGELVSPFAISGLSSDSVYFVKWIDGFKGQQWVDIPVGDFTEIMLDPLHQMPELFRLNNNIRKTGIFKKADPIRTQFYFTIEDPDKRSIMYIPAVNWNREDGFMLGIALHNGFLVPKPIEYFVMPFYSFLNTDLAGFGNISYNITPYNKLIRMATISLEGARFGAPGNQNYHKVKTGLTLNFRNDNVNNQIKQKVYGYYIAATNLYQIEQLEKASMSSFLQFGYQFKKAGFINPFSIQASVELNETFQKTALELNYKYSYYGTENGLDIRLFAGAMLQTSEAVPFYALSASGRSGRELYLYQGTYPDRFTVFPESLLSRQMTLSEGGLVSPLNEKLGYSEWLISLTLTSSLPGKMSRIPVKPFVNVLLNDHGSGTAYNSPLFFEAGLKAGIWDIIEVYVPMLVSRNIEANTGVFKDRIRIILNLDIFNQEKLKARFWR
ncbi:MAG: M1 family metallopeptidase, partial [Lentimicrobium sp.]|nr:M1 family metallopeptidase [Lentimicrobium sp.]